MSQTSSNRQLAVAIADFDQKSILEKLFCQTRAATSRFRSRPRASQNRMRSPTIRDLHRSNITETGVLQFGCTTRCVGDQSVVGRSSEILRGVGFEPS